jgi:hypothetical protein
MYTIKTIKIPTKENIFLFLYILSILILSFPESFPSIELKNSKILSNTIYPKITTTEIGNDSFSIMNFTKNKRTIEGDNENNNRAKL